MDKVGTGRHQSLNSKKPNLEFVLVPEAGLEPAQGCPYRILSPARLPFHHSGTRLILITDGEVRCKRQFKVQRSMFNGLWGLPNAVSLLSLNLRTWNVEWRTKCALEDQLPALVERSDADKLRMFYMLQLSEVAHR